ncbi:MAG: methyl-accepting chemotaxis protein [Clostridium sp.]|nr:methyl-accepting chemotaxis protein [Clostridium sp.]
MAKQKAGKAPRMAKAEKAGKAPRTEGAGKGFSFHSIITKMIAAFMALIAMIVILGTVSYQVAKRTVTNEVKTSLVDTVSAKGSYLELGLQQVEDRMLEIMTLSETVAYYLDPNLNIDKMTEEQREAKGVVQSRIQSLQTISDFVYHAYLISDHMTGLSTTPAVMTSDLYELFIGGEDGAAIDASSDNYGYMGAHPTLEARVLEKLDTFESGDFAISLWRKINIRGNLILVVDVDRSVIYDALAELDNGAGSYTVFIAPGGNETVYCGTDNGKAADGAVPVFSELSAYQNAMSAEAADGYSEMKWNGRQYLFAYSKIGGTGAMLATFVPTGLFLESAKTIQRITFLIVFVAFAAAVVMCILLSRTLSGGVSNITEPLGRAAQGDFTVSLRAKRKDEFGQISDSIEEMIGGIRKLIAGVKQVMGTVTDASGLVGDNTDRLIASSNEISLAIGEIEHGVAEQAQDSQNCVQHIQTLSDQIRTVYEYTDEITRVSEDANRTITDGMKVIDDLSEKSRATEDITGAIHKDIMSLSEQTRSIGDFANIINDIASQTNLLSLNASIEAARAGDAGRGFSVVAEEIRKLADQSLTAANQIGEIVERIQRQTGETVDSVNRANEIVASQSDSLQHTLDAFHNVNSRVGMMVGNLSKITEGMELIENTKTTAVNVIMNISAVSEQTSANSQQVEGNARRQKEAVEELQKTVNLLRTGAEQLDEAVSHLRVE